MVSRAKCCVQERTCVDLPHKVPSREVENLRETFVSEITDAEDIGYAKLEHCNRLSS